MTTYTVKPLGTDYILLRPKAEVMVQVTAVPSGRLLFQGIPGGKPFQIPPLEVGETSFNVVEV